MILSYPLPLIFSILTYSSNVVSFSMFYFIFTPSRFQPLSPSLFLMLLLHLSSFFYHLVILGRVHSLIRLESTLLIFLFYLYFLVSLFLYFFACVFSPSLLSFLLFSFSPSLPSAAYALLLLYDFNGFSDTSIYSYFDSFVSDFASPFAFCVGRSLFFYSLLFPTAFFLSLSLLSSLVFFCLSESFISLCSSVLSLALLLPHIPSIYSYYLITSLLSVCVFDHRCTASLSFLFVFSVLRHFRN